MAQANRKDLMLYSHDVVMYGVGSCYSRKAFISQLRRNFGCGDN